MDEEVKQLKKLLEMGLIGNYKKKTYPIIIENNFIRNQKYTVQQKMVYLCLQSYDITAGNWCMVSKEVLAKDLKVGVKTIYTILKQLEELEALLIINCITDTKGKTNNLYMLADIDENTGDFVKENLQKYKCLKIEPLIIRSKQC